MSVAEVLDDPAFEIYRWTADEFRTAINAGAIREPRRFELLDGIIERKMPQGDLHRFVFMALHRVFVAMGAFGRGMKPTPTVFLEPMSAISAS